MTRYTRATAYRRRLGLIRYILIYQGSNAKPDADVGQIRAVPGVHVVGELASMVLVEAEDSAVPILKQMPDWKVTLEQKVSVPRPPRQRIIE